MQTEEPLRIKVKTMDDCIFEYELQPTDTVLKLKELISEVKKKCLFQEIEIPVERQRIIFMGKLLKDGASLQDQHVHD